MLIYIFEVLSVCMLELKLCMAYLVSKNFNNSVCNHPISLQFSNIIGIALRCSVPVLSWQKLGAMLGNVYCMQQTKSAVGDFVISVRIYNKMIIKYDTLIVH